MIWSLRSILFTGLLLWRKNMLSGEGTPQEIFHDDETLDFAMLKAPYAVRIARELGLGEEITSNAELIEVLAAR